MAVSLRHAFVSAPLESFACRKPLSSCHRVGSRAVSLVLCPSQRRIEQNSIPCHSHLKRPLTVVCHAGSPNVTSEALERAEPVSTPQVEKLLDTIKWDSRGLVVAIAQHVDTGAILMQGFANREAISATLASRRATFFSRSRCSLWTKGESSRNFINVTDVFLDCDRDSVIYLGNPDGPTCHTGAETCYYTSIGGLESTATQQALTTLYALEATIAQRKTEVSPKPSWTKKLLGNPTLLCSKIREEAGELCRTVEEGEGRERTVSEMADVLYHAMVLLAVQDVKVQEVMDVLRGRFSKSGIEEKMSRVVKT